MKLLKPLPKKTTAGAAVGLALTALLTSTLALSGSAADLRITMGSTQNFAVLAGSGITNTGATTVSGTFGADLGSAPTTTFVGDVLVTTTGTKYVAGSAVVDAAKNDLVIAYNDAATRIPATTVAGDLGGQTLQPGVYNSATSIGLTGTLTLDGQGDLASVFVFQAGSTLTTASASQIVLLNGAQACNVFWQVGSSATFGTNSVFIGNVLALTSITATTGASFQGQLLARNGAVTLDTNTIVNNACVTAPIVFPSPVAPIVEPIEEPVETEIPSPNRELIEAPEEGGVLPDTDSTDWLLGLFVAAVLSGLGVFTLVFRRGRD